MEELDPDISLYKEHPERYELFQSLRPDYSKGIEEAISLAKKHAEGLGKVSVADFCSGTGSNTRLLGDETEIELASLVDINRDFLLAAKDSGIKAERLQLHEGDIIEVELQRIHNLNLSIFAYHHVPDGDKPAFVQKIKESLLPGGICIVAEIYLDGEQENLDYYQEVLEAIPEEDRPEGLDEFLMQTAKSHTFEFKVPKITADGHFKDAGFTLLEEVKIYPGDDGETGMFVQVYKLD